MQRRIDAHDELAGIGFLRLFPALLAEGEVVFDRVGESLLQLRNRSALKGNDITESQHFAMKDLGVLVILYKGLVSLICHHVHGAVRNRRTALTAPLSVSFCGCGR